jgi:hypothetical protein
MLLRTFARFVLILSLSGVVPQAFARQSASDTAGLRAEGPSAVLSGTIRQHDGSTFTKSGVRADMARGQQQRGPAALTAGISALPPQANGTCVARRSVSALSVSRSSATLRGPPDSL